MQIAPPAMGRTRKARSNSCRQASTSTEAPAATKLGLRRARCQPAALVSAMAAALACGFPAMAAAESHASLLRQLLSQEGALEAGTAASLGKSGIGGRAAAAGVPRLQLQRPRHLEGEGDWRDGGENPALHIGVPASSQQEQESGQDLLRLGSAALHGELEQQPQPQHLQGGKQRHHRYHHHQPQQWPADECDSRPHLSDEYVAHCGAQPPPTVLRCSSWNQCIAEHGPSPPTSSATFLVVDDTGQQEEAEVTASPLFLLVGAQKAGTTNLRSNLLKTPHLAAKPREAHYFDFYFPMFEVDKCILDGADTTFSSSDFTGTSTSAHTAAAAAAAPSEAGPTSGSQADGGGGGSRRAAADGFAAPSSAGAAAVAAMAVEELTAEEAARRARCVAAAVLPTYGHQLLYGERNPVPEDQLAGVSEGSRWVFDSSPAYVALAQVPERVFTALPRLKAVLMVRDPVARYHSAARMYVCRSGKSGPTEFLEATMHKPGELRERLARWEERYAERRRAGGAVWRWAHEDAFDLDPLTRGVYADDVAHWLRFFPPRQLLVIDSGRYFAEPQVVVDEVLAFLGLPPHVVPDVFENMSPVGKCKDERQEAHAQWAQQVEAEGEDELLRQFYAPHNQRLYDLLGRDLGW